MRLGSMGLGAAVLVALTACSSTPEAGTGQPAVSTPIGGAAPSAPAGGGGAGKPGTSPAPAVATPPASVVPSTTTTSGAAGSSAAGAAAVSGGIGGGAGARAGNSAAPVAGASAGAPAAGSGVPTAGSNAVAAGSGGSAGSTAAPGGGYMRGADPTEDSLKKNGEYTVKSYTESMGLVGGMAYGDAAIGGDGSELYYPENATPPFAAMAIVPGFTAQRSDVTTWGPFLASHGIVALVIDTNTVGDQPDVRSRALLDALESLKKENAREGSPVKGKLDTSRLGLMGWSMGGGGTWISADAHPELKVAVSLCGWILGAVGGKTTVPSLQLAVRDDQLAAGMSQPVYAAIPEKTPKMLVEWASGGHWINNSPESVDHLVGRYGLPWIKVYLEGDERYRQFFKSMPTRASDFRTNQ